MGLFGKKTPEIDNSYYGGFIVSNNIMNGRPVKYSYREESSIPQLNGWTLYSDIDGDEYVNDSANFTILSAESLFKLCPVFRALYEAPYGTDICWLYEGKTLTGFYDLKADRETTIEEIVSGGR